MEGRRRVLRRPAIHLNQNVMAKQPLAKLKPKFVISAGT
jgi:hypothetical protein